MRNTKALVFAFAGNGGYDLMVLFPGQCRAFARRAHRQDAGYAVFNLELIVGFFSEGAPQAALVMGGMTGIVAIVWGVLLKRFVFAKT